MSYVTRWNYDHGKGRDEGFHEAEVGVGGGVWIVSGGVVRVIVGGGVVGGGVVRVIVVVVIIHPIVG